MTELRAADGRPIVEITPAPEFFIQKVAHIEAVGDDCFRFYCCTERGSEYHLQYTVIMPASVVLSNTLTVREIARVLTVKARTDVH